MSATAIKSPQNSHSHSHSHSQSRSRPTTTPRGYPHSVGQAKAPLLTPISRSPVPDQTKSPSPSYFGFVVGGDDSIPPDSNPGQYARQNWTNSNPSAHSTAAFSRPSPHESNPDFEAFRRQSDSKTFSLNSSLSSMSRPPQLRTQSAQVTPRRLNLDSPISPHSKKSTTERPLQSTEAHDMKPPQSDTKSFFDLPTQQSPVTFAPKQKFPEHDQPRLSLPMNELKLPSFGGARKPQRSDTLPPSNDTGSPAMVSANKIVELMQESAQVLLLDLRVYQQYSAARIRGALNLCIPTTLIKRPTFTTQKLSDTFASARDKAQFDRWQECKYIIVYDANSSQSKEATTCINVLKKFSSEGWDGTGYVVKGGFLAFSRQAPDMVDRGAVMQGDSPSTQASPASPPNQDIVPVAGGCSMPATKSAANPFFGNIRQNMDLLDGVGQIPIKKPSEMSKISIKALPEWLEEASRPADEGKIVSDKFLSIERSEQQRMQDALTAEVTYGTPGPNKQKRIQVAGIEKGSKNRYNNIFPFEHSRVRLQSVSGDCDYVNASHVQAEYSNRHYIATQAPIPTTFNDFWKVVWEQDVRVLVMLTAEAEGGQVKSHVYWNPGEYGQFKVKKMSERQVQLEPKQAGREIPTDRRPSLGQRRSTTNNLPNKQLSENEKMPAEVPSVWVRRFTLSHTAYPFQPLREITQLQYTQWPDFGAPANPNSILGLIDQVNKYVRDSSSPSNLQGLDEAAPKGQRPILVHCSAGCGRTGTFCTIDSVIDMLKRQKADQDVDMTDSESDDDNENDREWVHRNDQDLIAKTVEDFRHQRLSMVQNLRQFVLCYESVLQWHVQQQHSSESGRPELTRRSSQS